MDTASLFGESRPDVGTNKAFWEWFVLQEKNFHRAIQQHDRIEEEFLNIIGPVLNRLRPGYNVLAGMINEQVAELIISPDGVLENIVFTEELIAEAPLLEGWQFTALKPAVPLADLKIVLGPYLFNESTLSFYENTRGDYPDEIDITICYDSFKNEHKDQIVQGVYLFLDSFLGELKSVLCIDHIDVKNKVVAEKEVVPISKLKDYITWRQHEFVEKYEGIRRTTHKDTYHSMQAKLANGKSLIAIINTDLIQWDRKASHPWMLSATMVFKETNTSGMPDEKTYELLETIEQEILSTLIDAQGYLHIGRQTVEGKRTIYFACKDFRVPAKTMDALMVRYDGIIKIECEIFKDKYWKSLSHFDPKGHIS